MLFIGAYLLFFICVDNCNNQLFVSERDKNYGEKKKKTDKSAAVSALLLPCIHICKKNNLFGVGHTACSETRQGLVAASSRKFSN